MFSLLHKKGNERTGEIQTKNGEIKTPFFMPDATRGFVKSLDKEDLENLQMGPMVVNTYHLYLQPGLSIIKKAGGVNKFMDWDGPLLSDSGGYQVFSLIHKNPQMGKITDKEVIFRSPADGALHKLTPEKAIQIQFDLGVSMMVCLDDPPPNDYPKKKIAEAVERTLRWAERCMTEYKKQLRIRKIKEKDRPLIFCVIQGGEYLDLRKKCAEGLIKIGLSAKGGPARSWDGYGFGARHVDSQGKFLEKVLKYTASLIPENSLRFALGVGKPEDIVKCFSYGWDMFDCVIPTREGRHGRLFIRKGNFQFPNPNFQTNSKSKIQKSKTPNFYETININNSKYKNIFTPIDKKCTCDTCQNYTRAYLHHLFAVKEPLGQKLASIHNLKFYLELMEELRRF